MRTSKSSISTFVAVAAVLVLGGAPAFAVEPADTVFTGGKVYTVSEAKPWAEAIAVKGSGIVYIGDDAGAKVFIGDDTEVLDLAGKMVTPGFISAHDHLVASEWMNLGAQLYEGKSLDNYLKTIKDYAEAHADEEVIRGIGWSIENTGGHHPTAARRG